MKAMDIPVKLRQHIVDFLTALPNIHDNKSRQAFILSAGLDSELQEQIDFTGAAKPFFQILVETFLKYGKLQDGRHALIAVLEAAKNILGQEGQAQCEEFIKQLRKPIQPDVSQQPQGVQVDWVAYLEAVARELGNPPELRSIFPKDFNFDFSRIRVSVQLSEERLRYTEAFQRERKRAAGWWMEEEKQSKRYARRSIQEYEEQASRGVVQEWEQVRGDLHRPRLRRAIILGDPGFGKSWLLRYEGRTLALAEMERLQHGQVETTEILIPVFARLEHLARKEGSFLSRLQAALKEKEVSLEIWELIEAKIKSGKAVLLLDGWDEVRKKRGMLQEALENFVLHTPQCRFYLTSRIAGYVPLNISAKEWELVSFSLNQIEEFIGNFFSLSSPQYSESHPNTRIYELEDDLGEIESASAWSTEQLSDASCFSCQKLITDPAVKTSLGWLCVSCTQFKLQADAENEDFAGWSILQFKEALSPAGRLRWRLTVLWKFNEVLRLLSEQNPSEKDVHELMVELVRNLGYVEPHPLAQSVRQAASDVCRALGERILPLLLEMCDSNPWQFYANIVMISGSSAPKNEKVRILLKKAVQDPNPEVRRYVLIVISTHDSPWARELLQALTVDPDPSIRDLTTKITAKWELGDLLKHTPQIRGLARIPLMLVLLCRLYWEERVLPIRRAEIYNQCLWGLMWRWRKEKGKDPIEAEARVRHKLNLLSNLALQLLQDTPQTDAWDLEEFTEQISRAIEKSQLRGEQIDKLVGELVTCDGVLVREGEGDKAPLRFLHLTFQEYLAARALAKKTDWLRIVEQWFDSFWEPRTPVLELLAGEIQDITPLVKLFLEYEDPFDNILLLAARCVVETKDLQPSCMEEIHQKAEQRSRRKTQPARAAQTLAWLGLRWQTSLNTLIQKLYDENWNLDIHHAAEILVQLGDRRVVEPLLNTLHNNKDSYYRQFAIRALGQLRDCRTVERLCELLQNEDADIRCVAAEALGELGDLRAVEPLCELLESELRLNAHREVVTFEGPEGKVHSMIMGKEQGKWICRAAAEALGKIGDKRTCVRKVLFAVLGDEDNEVGKASAEALKALLASDQVVELFCEMLCEDENADYRKVAAISLGRLSDRRVVPLLLQVVLCREEREDVRGCAILALGQLSDSRAVEPLCELLQNEDRNVSEVLRKTAVMTLGKLGDRRAVGPLCKLLYDNDKEVCGIAARALGQIGDYRAEEPLCGLLQDEDRDVRMGALVALGQLEDTRTVGSLMQVAFHDEDRDIRVIAVKTLSEWGGSYVWELLLKTLHDDNGLVGSVAADALGELGDCQAVEPLCEALQNENTLVRVSAAAALGKLGDTRAVEPLLKNVPGKDDWLPGVATQALGKLGDLRAVPLLVRIALHDDDWDSRKTATIALESIDRKLREEGNQGLWGKMPEEQKTDSRNEDEAFRRGMLYILAAHRAVKALGQMEDRCAVLPLIEALQSVYAETRFDAALALGQIGDCRAVEPLCGLLQDENSQVRSAAARALRKLGDNRAVEPLCEALHDEERLVRLNVVITLNELDDDRAALPLFNMLRDQDKDVRGATAYALGRLRDNRAVIPLCEVLCDEDNKARFLAVWALGELNDSRAIEPLRKLLHDEDKDVREAASKVLETMDCKKQDES